MARDAPYKPATIRRKIPTMVIVMDKMRVNRRDQLKSSEASSGVIHDTRGMNSIVFQKSTTKAALLPGLTVFVRVGSAV